ncbi:TPA: baseplate protein [Enterobacter cloacae]
MANYSRLDNRSVEDPIIRAYLHREIIRQSERYDDDTNFIYTIKSDEVYRPDLVAYRAWGSEDLRWVINVLAGNEAETDPLPVGQDLTLPSAAFIRDRVRHYTETAEIEQL